MDALAGCVPAPVQRHLPLFLRHSATTSGFQKNKRRLDACATAVRAPFQASAHHCGAHHVAPWEYCEMNNFFNDLQGKINQAIENSPAKDIEKNVKAMMTQGFSKLDLVTREEFEIQAQVLAKTRAKLDLLELRVAELEAKLATPVAKD
jgi:BMFP domain-containing protein YqiC